MCRMFERSLYYILPVVTVVVFLFSRDLRNNFIYCVILLSFLRSMWNKCGAVVV